MKRLILPLLLIPFLISACTDDSVAPTVELGKTSIDEFLQNTAYKAWYDAGYDIYPPTGSETAHQSAVDAISSELAAGEGTWRVAMVVKPNCGCEDSKREMPRVMKTLDDAGFPHDQVDVWITDTRLAGIDEIKDAYGIDIAPTFLVLKNGVESGRIEIESATTGAEISTALASAFVGS